SRSWIWRRTACFAVWAAIRLNSSAGSSRTSMVPSCLTIRLRTSSAPVVVSSSTTTSPSGVNARLYAAASAISTVCSISSKGMPSSAQSAVSASAKLSVDGSDCDREPARDNVFPCEVNDHRRSAARAGRLHRDARAVDGHQLTLDDGLGLAASIADVDPLAIESFVLVMRAKRALRARRCNLEVVRTLDQVRMVEQGAGDSADALAV